MTKMTEIFARQGLDTDPDRYERAKQARRDKNMAAAREVLTRNQIAYTQSGEQWFMIDEPGHRIHYHPWTGEWIDYEVLPIRKRYGIRNLVRHIRGEVN